MTEDHRDFFEVLDHTDLIAATVATDVESCPVIAQTSEQELFSALHLVVIFAISWWIANVLR